MGPILQLSWGFPNPTGDHAASKGFLRACLPPATTSEGPSSICHLGGQLLGGLVNSMKSSMSQRHDILSYIYIYNIYIYIHVYIIVLVLVFTLIFVCSLTGEVCSAT